MTMTTRVFAQVASEWSAPLTGIGVVGILGVVLRWFMHTVTPQLKAIEMALYKHTVLLEQALDMNTRATLLLGIAQEESGKVVRGKMEELLRQIDQRKDEKLFAEARRRELGGVSPSQQGVD